jgi:HNH endonuclease
MAKLTSNLRQIIRTRAKGYREYCMSHDECGTSPFNIEHIFPTILNGTDDLVNLAYACSGCNGAKFIKSTAFDPISEQNWPLFNPRTQKWDEHFTWDTTLTLIIGQTPVGRATILALRLNRLQLINLRKATILFGIHPPK